MKFVTTSVVGAYLIELDRIEDERGFFARRWCDAEFAEQGLKAVVAQSNVGVSRKAGTLRGLHFQTVPHTEVKVVRCPRGAVYDVIVDLRPESPSYTQWVGVELSAENGRAIYVPEGCAQGYLTMMDDTEVYYNTSEFYHPESASGIRYNDPAFDIEWPREITMISEQDQGWAPYEREIVGIATNDFG